MTSIIRLQCPIDQALNDTAFEKLMSEVLNKSFIGTTAVFAEPDVGKSIATTLAVLKMEATQSKLTVVLQGGFKWNLKRFFRLEDEGDVEAVARCVFRLLENHGICLQLVFDNAFDAGLETGLLALGRLAFERGHNVIVIMRSKEMAIEVANLNGARTRMARQQEGSVAEEYRWSEHLARQYLNSTVITECQRRNGSFDDVMCRWLNATETRDQFGGWKPFDMNLCISGILKLGVAPPTLGQWIAWRWNALMLMRPQRCLLLLSHSPERYNINLTVLLHPFRFLLFQCAAHFWVELFEAFRDVSRTLPQVVQDKLTQKPCSQNFLHFCTARIDSSKKRPWPLQCSCKHLSTGDGNTLSFAIWKIRRKSEEQMTKIWRRFVKLLVLSSFCKVVLN